MVAGVLALAAPGSPLHAQGELSDSRAYDTRDGGVLTTNEVNAFEPVQAFPARELHEPFGAGTAAAVQLGRFTLNLGSRRMVASDEYRNTPGAYTGLRADLHLANKAQATLVFVMPQQRRPDDPQALRDNKVGFDRAGLLRDAPNSSPHGDTMYGSAALTYSF